MKKFLMIGAGFLQTYVIKKAKELGYYVYALDGSPTAPGFQFADEYKVINIVDKELCLEYAMEKGIDGVLTAATDYGVLTASHIAKNMKLPGINYESATTIKNKYQIRKKLFEAKADDTEQSYEVSNDEDIEYVKSVMKLPVMVKPCDGSGSRGASKVENKEDFEKACKAAMECSLTHKAIVETFIVGKEYGVESIVCGGKIHVLGVMRKWMTKAPYYAELGHSIPSCLDKEVEEKIKACVYRAIEALGVNFGSVNMDLLLSEDNSVHIVDIGARMGGNLIGSSIIPVGTGVDYIEAMIRSAVGDDASVEPKRTPRCVVTRLLALTPGLVKALPDFDAVEKEYGVEVHHHLNVGERINEYHTNLDGCGYVVAVHEDYDTALDNAVKALDKIDKDIVRE